MFTITNKLRTVIALGAVGTALAGTTLATAAPAFAAAKQPVTRTQTTTFGHGPGAGCPAPWGTVPDGTTLKTTITYSDGSSTTSTATCQNGKWVTARALSVGSIDNVAVPTTHAIVP